jgi:hypothetical protein
MMTDDTTNLIGCKGSGLGNPFHRQNSLSAFSIVADREYEKVKYPSPKIQSGINYSCDSYHSARG